MFSQELRDRLVALKAERDSGILPEEIYVDMCRNLIREMGPPIEEDTKISEASDRKPKMEDVNTRNENIRKDVDDSDKRKHNRGVDHRRSYTKEEKLIVIILKESGMPADEVAKTCGISRSNVEKWTTEKTKIPIIEKCRNLLINGMFNKSSINFIDNDNEKMKRSLFESIVNCFPSANSSLDAGTAELLVAALTGSGPGGVILSNSILSSSSSGGRGGYHTMPYPSGSETDLQQFDDADLSEFGDIGDFPGGVFNSMAYRTVQGTNDVASSSGRAGNSSGGNLNGNNNNKNSKVRKAPSSASAAAAAPAPPAKRSKLMTELLEAAGLYFNEAEGSSSMNLEDYIRPPRPKVPPAATAAATGSSAAAAQTGSSLPGKVISAVGDAESYEKDQFIRPHHTAHAVSDMTMSYDSSALSDDRFSATSIAAPGTTSQALRPVLRNTAFFSSIREQMASSKTTILDDRGDQKLSAQEQLEEDREVMKFLGEKQYKLGLDRNDMKKFTITEVE